MKVIEVREISKKQAEKEILDYMNKKGKAWTSEIADDLRLDVVFVNGVLTDLAKRGKLE